MKRTYRAGWVAVILGVIATSVGILGNLAINFVFLGYFAIYFVPAVLGGIAMYMRIPILKWILTLLDRVLTRFSHWREGVEEKIVGDHQYPGRGLCGPGQPGPDDQGLQLPEPQ